MTRRESETSSNTIQLHIDRDELTVDQFLKSVNAFTQMIEVLAKDASDSVSWRMSVESGSTCINAMLVSDDEDALSDVTPVYRVIERDVFALSSGKNVEVVPKSARKHYADLVNAVGKTDDNLPGGKLVLAYDSETRRREVLVEMHVEATLQVPSEYIAIGSVTGLLCGINSRKGNFFSIVNEETGRVVRGSYEDDLLDGFRSAFKRRATVSGILSYGRGEGINLTSRSQC